MYKSSRNAIHKLVRDDVTANGLCIAYSRGLVLTQEEFSLYEMPLGRLAALVSMQKTARWRAKLARLEVQHGR